MDEKEKVLPQDEQELTPEEEGAQPETQAGEQDETRESDEIIGLMAQISELEAALSKTKDAHLRTAAEYDNFRKRTSKEKDALYLDVTAGSVAVLLPVLDNLERALSAENSSVEDMRKGLEMICTAGLAAFEKLGVSSFGEAGEVFDPNLHNCIGTVSEGEVEDGQIALVLQKGYALGGKIIRPAMVQVKQN